MNCPTIAGITARSACGSTMNASVFVVPNPSACAASTCPLGTACRPPRIVSARYAAEKSVMAMNARITRFGLYPVIGISMIPSERSRSGRNTSGNRYVAKNRIVIKGTPRITSM